MNESLYNLLLENHSNFTDEVFNQQVLICCTARALLDFRLRNGMSYLTGLFTESGWSISRLLNALIICCRDYDFSKEFGQYGGHFFIKKLLRSNDSAIQELSDEVVSTIIASGCEFPSIKQVDDLGLHRPHRISFKYLCPPNNEFDVYLRSVNELMHGKGQFTVGYILWPSSIILSRILLNMNWLLNKKNILELGAGLGLAGLVSSKFASYVCLTDFNEVVLENLQYNVNLNIGSTKINGVSAVGEFCHIEVKSLDFYKQIIQSDIDLSSTGTVITASAPSQPNQSQSKSQTQSQDQYIIPDQTNAVLRNTETLAENTICNYNDNNDNNDDYDNDNDNDGHGSGGGKPSCLLELPHGKVFEVIIAADVICCAADATHCARAVAARLLRPAVHDRTSGGDDGCDGGGCQHRHGGLGIMVMEGSFHRFGVEELPGELAMLGLQSCVVPLRRIDSTSAVPPATSAEYSRLKDILRQFFPCDSVGSYTSNEVDIDVALDRFIAAFGDELYENIEQAAYHSWSLILEMLDKEVEDIGDWRELMGNDLRFKKIKIGSDTSVELNSNVTCSIHTYTLPSNALVEFVDKESFLIGEADTIPGLELCIRHSNLGDKIEVFCSSRFAYGTKGRPPFGNSPAIPPDTDLRFDVYILETDDNNSNTGDPVEESLQYVTSRKNAGNRWFKYSEFTKAARCYSKGAEHIEKILTDESTDIQKRLKSLFIDCLNNLAVCHISNNDFYKAKETCLKLLEIDPTNIKGLLRAGRASLALHNFEESELCLTRLLEYDPENEAGKKEMIRLRKAQRDYKLKSKKVAKTMAKSLFNNDETEENSRTPENIDTPKSDTTCDTNNKVLEEKSNTSTNNSTSSIASTPTPPSSFFRRMSPSLIMTTASLLVLITSLIIAYYISISEQKK